MSDDVHGSETKLASLFNALEQSRRECGDYIAYIQEYCSQLVSESEAQHRARERTMRRAITSELAKATTGADKVRMPGHLTEAKALSRSYDSRFDYPWSNVPGVVTIWASE